MNLLGCYVIGLWATVQVLLDRGTRGRGDISGEGGGKGGGGKGRGEEEEEMMKESRRASEITVMTSVIRNLSE